MADGQTSNKDRIVMIVAVAALVLSVVALGWAIKTDRAVDNHFHSSTTSGAEPERTGEGEGNLMHHLDTVPAE